MAIHRYDFKSRILQVTNRTPQEARRPKNLAPVWQNLVGELAGTRLGARFFTSRRYNQNDICASRDQLHSMPGGFYREYERTWLLKAKSLSIVMRSDFDKAKNSTAVKPSVDKPQGPIGSEY